MVDIKKYVEEVNLKGDIFINEDIHNLFLLLQDYFKCGVKGLIFTHEHQYPMYYALDSRLLWVNYEWLKKLYEELIVSKNTDLDHNILLNYYFAFALIHEFIHGLQHDGKAADVESINALYAMCFAYVQEGHIQLKRVISNIIYQRLHDYMATEINANVRAYEFLLSIVRNEYRDYFMQELYEMIRKCYLDYNLYDMYANVLKIDEIYNLSFPLRIEDKVRHGVFLAKDERREIMDGREIKLEKVIDCKLF